MKAICEATALNMTFLNEYKDLLSVDDLATIFGTTRNTIYAELKRGKFGTPIKIGRTYKIPKVYILKKYIAEYQ